MNKTINYYNDNAQAFYERTIGADLSDSYQAFLKYLPDNPYILDAGCGSGRDSKFFLKEGCAVTAFDASQAMAALAAKETGLNVLNMTFQEMNFHQEFDGVWAQASLLHIPYQETRKIYEKIHHALKPGGIFYAAYKYGQEYMPTEERDFWNMDEEKVKPYLAGLFEIIEIWTTPDKTSKIVTSPSGLWLKFIGRKVS
jgi:SAM-dependent methyltransferase